MSITRLRRAPAAARTGLEPSLTLNLELRRTVYLKHLERSEAVERLEHWNGLFSCFMEPLERMERLELLERNHWLLSNQELAFGRTRYKRTGPKFFIRGLLPAIPPEPTF